MDPLVFLQLQHHTSLAQGENQAEQSQSQNQITSAEVPERKKPSTAQTNPLVILIGPSEAAELQSVSQQEH